MGKGLSCEKCYCYKDCKFILQHYFNEDVSLEELRNFSTCYVFQEKVDKCQHFSSEISNMKKYRISMTDFPNDELANPDELVN